MAQLTLRDGCRYGLELYFIDRPDSSTEKLLKANGFRKSKYLAGEQDCAACWFSPITDEAYAIASRIGGAA
jgi:hypothetical protein